MAFINIGLDEFDSDEIINHLENISKHLTEKQINKLRKICGLSPSENFKYVNLSEKIKKENLLVNDMKLEVILNNLDKYDYAKICEIFEN